MRREDHVVAAQEPGVLGERLDRHHVERGAAEPAGIERRDERRLVDQRTARRVHQEGPLLHSGEGLRVEQAARRRQQRRMDRDKVGRLEQPLEAHALDARRRQRLRRHIGIMGDDPHAEGLRLGGDRARNIAEADQAEDLAAQTPDRHDRRHFPAARLHQAVGEGNLAREREQQRHGVVGNLVQAIVGHIGDRDPALRRRRNVDVVDAEAETADHLAALELAQQIAGQLGVGDEHRVGVARDRQDVLGRSALGHPHLGIDALERRHRRIERREDAVGHRNQRPGHDVAPGMDRS